ncbi:hypothetical protein NHE_0558 [Neorickettsia helminthoeca str. Oregon]|uniref:Uncharacterized protein n=1 Tax=Neorickettsia helminthoeca str. Oregon TaxID=1286528 RepID=X5GWW1_9RICK|nr:hypothetical protein NHE_0558 [Neorickettsia helminthoeca str. Oregon]
MLSKIGTPTAGKNTIADSDLHNKQHPAASMISHAIGALNSTPPPLK